MRITDIIISVALAGVSVSAVAEHREPLDVTRVMWDLTSRKTIFESGNYCRIIPLQDGRLMAVAETYGTYSGITAAFSNDNGNSWGNKLSVAGNGDRTPSAVPDLIQLADGTIIVGYNPRPSQPWSEDRHFGIRCVRSTDNGVTWSDPIYIYDASWFGGDGCWEPSFLELPSGEIHCYFANEHPYTTSGEQEISMCRSFDKGLTWTDPIRVTFRAGSRDGMPSAIITDAGEIVVIVEDNGHPGRGGFRATTMRCTVEENWEDCWVSGSSDRRDMIFKNEEDKDYVSAAPYLRRLPSGETIASWQGDHWSRKGNGEDRFDMYVAVGDKDARNFGQLSQPFNVNADEHALWNSVAVGFDNRVFAIASIGGSNQICVMNGNALQGFTADYGTPEINASFSKETWTTKNCNQLLMGQYSRNRSTHDFLYDDENLYVFSYVTDRTPVNDTDVNDGIQLSLDIDNVSDTAPQKGIYTFFLDTDGTVHYAYGEDGEYHEAEAEGARIAVNAKKTYYMLEAAIPWKLMGLDTAPDEEQLMRVNLEVRDMDGKGGYRFEVIPECRSYESWTWPGFRLNGGEQDGVSGAPADPESNLPEGYYNLQGMMVTNPSGGIFVCRKGNKVSKVALP